MSFLSPLPHRVREQEWMDAPGADPDHLRKSLRFIRRINKYLGYTRATLSHLDRFSAHWNRNDPIKLLDIATGSADVPLAILDWSRRKHLNLHITGVDLHPKTAAEALHQSNGQLSIVLASAMNLPFPDNSFDYAMTSMFLHHLDEPDIVQVLKEMSRVSRRGVIIADLLRDPRAVFWIKLFTLFSNPMVKHDAVVSVRQAFKKDEILSLRDRAEIPFTTFHYHFGHRFVLAGEKPQFIPT